MHETNYIFRGLDLQVVDSFISAMDKLYRSIFQQILGREVDDQQWVQSRLKMEDGGFSVHNVAYQAMSAYLGSACIIMATVSDDVFIKELALEDGQDYHSKVLAVVEDFKRVVGLTGENSPSDVKAIIAILANEPTTKDDEGKVGRDKIANVQHILYKKLRTFRAHQFVQSIKDSERKKSFNAITGRNSGAYLLALPSPKTRMQGAHFRLPSWMRLGMAIHSSMPSLLSVSW